VSFASQIVAVLFVLCLLGALTLALRGRKLNLLERFMGRQPRRRTGLQSLVRLHLTPNHCLHVVDFGGKILLVATHPAGLSVEPVQDAFLSVVESEATLDSK